MIYTVRNANWEDLHRIEEIYACARTFMAFHGNPNQWGASHPPVSQLEQDIQNRLLYVLESENEIHGVFYFFVGQDPTYNTIDGAWHSDRSYGTIHRIAGDGSGGILKAAVDFCSALSDYLRIDTHADNYIMQRALEKLGFCQCGTIYVADGSPRIAYDRKTVCFDRTGIQGAMSVLLSGARVVPAGTIVSAMPVKYRQEPYISLEQKLNVHFIYADNIPEVPFYSVPMSEVIAYDHLGGYLGISGEDETLLYIHASGACWYLGENAQTLLSLPSDWRDHRLPYSGLKLYPSKESAMAQLEFLKLSQ